MKEENHIQKFQEELLADRGYQFSMMTEDGKAIWKRQSFVIDTLGKPMHAIYAAVYPDGQVNYNWKEE